MEHPFVALIESNVSDAALRLALLEGLVEIHSRRPNGAKAPSRKWFKRNPDGSLTDAEIDARINVLKRNNEAFGLNRYTEFDEDALRQDMKLHPKKYQGPVPMDNPKSMSELGDVVHEMDLPSMEELRKKCYTDTIVTINSFFRKCKRFDFDAMDVLHQVLMEDETNNHPLKFNRSIPFPKLDTIEDVRKAWLVKKLAESNLPFKSALDRAYKLDDDLKAAEAEGPDAVDRFKFQNYFCTYDVEKERKEEKLKAEREAKYNL